MSNTVKPVNTVTVKPRKDYVTKLQKDHFITWYLNRYGYNVKLKSNNSRVLSEKYQEETGVYIPKITIYRWLGKMDDDSIQQKINDYVSVYVVTQFSKI